MSRRLAGGALRLGAMALCVAMCSSLLSSPAPAGPGRVALPATDYPPGPSYRSCPDSVTIFQVQQSDTTLNPCYPALGDVVQGIRGVITAFRLRSTGRIYIENTSVADYNGLQIYTVSHTESAPWSFAIGDSISIVTGISQAYQNESQIQGNMTGSPITLIATRIVAAADRGHVLPPFRLGTTTEYKWRPATGSGSAFATCNPREGELVRVNDPLKVARVQGGDGLYSTTNWLLVNKDGSAPGDSILVDGYTLTSANILAPPLDTEVEWVQGILRRATNNGVDCWLITLRDANDIAVAAPPNVTDAFPIVDNDQPGGSRLDSIMVVFDRAVEETSAESAGNYSLGSYGTVNGAHRLDAPGDNRVVLEIQNGLDDGEDESVTVSAVKALSNGLPMTSPQTRSFVNGVLSIATVQAPDPAYLGISPCADRSRFAGPGSAAGPRLSVSGKVTAALGAACFLQDGDDPRSGLTAYTPIVALTPGRRYLFVGAVQEFYDETECVNNVYVRDYGAAAAPAPTVQTVGVLSGADCDSLQILRNGEDYESMLVRVERVRITQTRPAGTSFLVAGTSPAFRDTILIGAEAGNFTFAADSGRMATITGVLDFDFGAFRICPRSNSDIVDLGSGAVFSAPLCVSKSGTASRDPAFLRDGNGSLFVAWGREYLQAAYSLSLDDGANWSPPKAVPRQGREPALVIADSNKICVLTAGLDSLRFNQSVDGGIQMLPVTALIDGFRAEYPRAAVGSAGHIHVAWERHQAGIYYARSFSGGASFSTPAAIALDNWPSDRHSMVRLCASPGDSVYAFWNYQRAGGPANNRVLFSRSLDGGTTFSPPVSLSDTTKYVLLGDAQIAGGGGLYLMWLTSGAADSVAFLRSTDGGASFTILGYPPAPALSGTCPKSFHLGPAGAIDAVVGICSTDLYFTHSSDGGVSWDPAVNFTNGSCSVGEPAGTTILFDRSGTPVVVWFGGAAGSSEIYFARKIN
jgi:hypothetical protein